MSNDEIPEFLIHAMNSEYCVLEFQEQPDGSMSVADVTGHMKKLERMVNE